MPVAAKNFEMSPLPRRRSFGPPAISTSVLTAFGNNTKIKKPRELTVLCHAPAGYDTPSMVVECVVARRAASNLAGLQAWRV
jgi:hypothetical protein